MSIRSWYAKYREMRYLRRRFLRETRYGSFMVIESNGLPDGYEPPSVSDTPPPKRHPIGRCGDPDCGGDW